MRYILFFIIFIFSCSINGTYQGLFTYQTSTLKKNPSLFTHIEACDAPSLSYKPYTVLITNGNLLRKCISAENSIVYIWRPNCSSKKCLPLDFIQNKCNELEMELFIVAEYYDLEKMNKKYNIQNSILAIDNHYYKTKFVKNQLKKFFQDLTGLFDFTNYMDSYFLFIDGNYVNSGTNLTTLVHERIN